MPWYITLFNVCHATPQDGLTRQQLDIALLVAEAELIEGLPAYPSLLPLGQSEAELPGGFKQRRVECMSSAHAIGRAETVDRLQLLEVSVNHGDCQHAVLVQQGGVPGAAIYCTCACQLDRTLTAAAMARAQQRVMDMLVCRGRGACLLTLTTQKSGSCAISWSCLAHCLPGVRSATSRRWSCGTGQRQRWQLGGCVPHTSVNGCLRWQLQCAPS